MTRGATIKEDEKGLYLLCDGCIARPSPGDFVHGYRMNDGGLVEGQYVKVKRLAGTDLVQLYGLDDWSGDRRNWRIEKPKSMQCVRCDGEGVVSAPYPSQPDKLCPVCYGSGVAPAKSAAKMTLEDMDKKQPAEPRGANWGVWG
jgi:hypothetical protein